MPKEAFGGLLNPLWHSRKALQELLGHSEELPGPPALEVSGGSLRSGML